MNFFVIKDAGMTDWMTKYDGHDPNPFANQAKAQFPIFGDGQDLDLKGIKKKI